MNKQILILLGKMHLLTDHRLSISLVLLSIYFPLFSCLSTPYVMDVISGGVVTCVYDNNSFSTYCIGKAAPTNTTPFATAPAAAPVPVPPRPEPKGRGGTKFRLVNNCSETVWAATRTISGNQPIPQSTGLEIPKGTSRAVHASTGWDGRFWGKTGCTFNSSCASGDTVATVAEFSTGSTAFIFYDVNIADGFNLPLLVNPVGGSGHCGSTGCVANLTKNCPEDLRTVDGRTCRSACTALHQCGPTSYTQQFKHACPLAYSYLTDDHTSFFTCTSNEYVITFCASSIPSLTFSDQPGTAMGPSVLPPSALPPSPSESPSSKRTSFPLRTIIGIVLGVVVLAIIITIVCCMRRRCSPEGRNKLGNQDIEKFLLQQGSLTLKRYKYSEIKKITKSFRDKLGRGGYGSVYKGVLPDGCLVAVKVLMESDSNGEEFINEVASISRTSHVNIVNLLGFCYDGNKRALVYQFMPNKSLDKFISNADCHLDLQKLCNIAVGVAKGLEYLHTGCNTRIVHFDIKPQNILLDEEFCPKISDFGLAKLCKKKQSILSVLGTRGTMGYIAPEVFSRHFGGVSHKSDVYSYGMMILEMAGARNTVEVEAIQSSTENYFPDKIYEQVILDVTNKLDDDFTFEEEVVVAKKMILVGFWCIQTIPSNRPSISKVVEMLEGSVGSIQIPPKPVLSTPTLPVQDVSWSFSSHVETENSAEYVDHSEVHHQSIV